MNDSTNVIMLELNEINFDFISKYIEQGHLPNFKALFLQYGYSFTESEKKYEELEPWIQWVTAHTGKSLDEHNVFRLGDIVQHDIEQIWEQLEARGLSVGAVSPMNAKNRTQNACFFIPDPWTKTRVTSDKGTEFLYNAIAQAVNDNARGVISLGSLWWIFVGLISNARIKNYLKYIKLVFRCNNKWSKALFLDLLLSDIFINAAKKTKPNFSTLFLNAGAHIQHHYMFSSPAYNGELKNPSWYVGADKDPLFDVYKLYDDILGDFVSEFPTSSKVSNFKISY